MTLLPQNKLFNFYSVISRRLSSPCTCSTPPISSASKTSPPLFFLFKSHCDRLYSQQCFYWRRPYEGGANKTPDNSDTNLDQDFVLFLLLPEYKTSHKLHGKDLLYLSVFPVFLFRPASGDSKKITGRQKKLCVNRLYFQ